MGTYSPTTPTPSPTPIPIPGQAGCGGCAGESIGTVRVVFAGKQCAGNPGDGFPDHYASSVAVGSGSGVQTFKSTALAYYSAPTSGDPTNKATLDALASRIASDWAPWRCVAQFDLVMSGVAAVQPTGLYEEIEWDLSAAVHATRIYSAPHNDRVQELGHFDYSGDCLLTATPCLYFYGPPGQCTSDGHLQLTRWKVCLEDGRLLQKYVSTDNIT